MRIQIGSPVPNERLALVDNQQAACIETGQEVGQVSLAETVAIIDHLLNDPTSRIRILVARANDNFAGHMVYRPGFCLERNARYFDCLIRTGERYRGLGVGRRLWGILAGTDVQTLLLPHNTKGIRFGQRFGLRPRDCELITRKMTAEQIEGLRRCYSIRNTTRGEIATFTRCNDAFEIARAEVNSTNHSFLVAGVKNYCAQVNGLPIDLLALRRGIATALRARNVDREDGIFFTLTRYAQDNQPIAFAWMSHDPSPYRLQPRVHAKLWIANSYRRMRLTKPLLEAALALFCAREKAIELRGLIPCDEGLTKEQRRAYEAIRESLGFQDHGERIQLEP